MLQCVHPDYWHTVILLGYVNGKGSGQKTKVIWTLGNDQVTNEVGAKVLKLVQVQLPDGAADGAMVPASPQPGQDGTESN